MASQTIPKDAIAALQVSAGSANWTDDPALLAPHLEEWRGKYHGKTDLMVKPRSAEHLSDIVKTAHQHRVALTPQGGNTGLVGGSLPGLGPVPSVLINFSHMTDMSFDHDSLVAGAGVPIAQVQQAADQHGRLFPLSLASEGSATVGGTIATNAGGIHVVRYGMMRALTLGVEAVLADGSIVDETAPLLKDNSGYRLTPLLAGSEGTLGLVTKARLALFPPEKAHITGWLEVDDIKAAIDLFYGLKDLCQGRLSVFELMSCQALQLAKTHIEDVPQILNAIGYTGAAWSILFELGLPTKDDGLENVLTDWLSAHPSLKNAALAQSDHQRQSLFSVREGLSEAQKRHGVSIKHDISLPLDQMPAFLNAAADRASRRLPGTTPLVFGHLGDGNLHYNIMEGGPCDAPRLHQEWAATQSDIHDLVADLGGSISAEHGIGRMKKQDLKKLYPTRYEAMVKLKQAMDPHGLFNPGVLFD